MGEAEDNRQDLLRSLPALGALLESETVKLMSDEFGEGLVKGALRMALDKNRQQILNGKAHGFDLDRLLAQIGNNLGRITDSSKRPVINASGILLHTGIGRAALSDEALAAIEGAGRYTILQTDIETGKRSLREQNIEWMLRELIGCEAATVINNNAAATMLVLNSLCAGKETVISRGQLIEIGGAYRIPDVMAMSSTIMREVGTTNRTHLKDYRNAYNEEATAALIHVHTSNYRVRGFSGTPGISELAALATELGVYCIDDLGSGALTSLSEWGLANEPLVKDSLAAGVDVACFSGDKLIGGPQCGIICGKAEIIEKIRKNPFARMFRVCKLTLAALEATLAIWLNGEHCERIPFYRMLGKSKRQMLDDAALVADYISDLFEVESGIIESEAYVGSGSIPDETVPSVALRLDLKGGSCSAFAAGLRAEGVFARVEREAILLEMITLLDGQADDLGHKLRRCLEHLRENN